MRSPGELHKTCFAHILRQVDVEDSVGVASPGGHSDEDTGDRFVPGHPHKPTRCRRTGGSARQTGRQSQCGW